jgi:hypothetical protein
MLALDSDRLGGELRGAFRHLESVWDALGEMGIEVLDHTGAPYNSGLELEVLAFQPMAELAGEQVLETIRPSVYINARKLQTGQVIVGTPLAHSESPHGAELL